MTTGFITPDQTALVDYAASRSTAGAIDADQLQANIVLGTSGQLGFTTPDQTALVDSVGNRSTAGQLPLKFERQPNLNRQVRWV